VEAARAKAAAAGFPSQTITEEQFEELGGKLVSGRPWAPGPACTAPARSALVALPRHCSPAAALPGSQDVKREQKAAEDQEKARTLEDIKKIEPVLQGVAAVPWLANQQARAQAQAALTSCLCLLIVPQPSC
jgi:hypothetical protein